MTDAAELPTPHARWVDEALGGRPPRETKATCDACVMLPASGAPAGAAFFDPATKCCTYIPELPNFLIGGLFAGTGDESGLRAIREAIAAGQATPLGLPRPRAHALLLRGAGAAGFGRAPALRCPYFDAARGGCGIWARRPAVCATWYCKHDRGAAGKLFWRDAVEQLLRAAERAVARWCVLELGLDAATLRRLLPPETTEPPGLRAADLGAAVDEDDRAASWGPWRGREEEFFRACAGRADALAWAEVRALGGVELLWRERVAREAFAELLRPGLPRAARLAPLALSVLADGRRLLVGYSPYDPLAVPAALVDVLHHFDGRPLDAALQAIADEAGVELAPELVQLLLDHEILLPA